MATTSAIEAEIEFIYAGIEHRALTIAINNLDNRIGAVSRRATVALNHPNMAGPALNAYVAGMRAEEAALRRTREIKVGERREAMIGVVHWGAWVAMGRFLPVEVENMVLEYIGE